MASTVSPLKLFLTGLYLLVWPALILLLAGDWRWTEGLLFGAWFVVMCATTIAWLYRKDPSLLAERYRRPGSGGQSRTDAAIVYLLLTGFISWVALMPLDARRFHWTPQLPLLLEVLGASMLLCAWFFLFRAFTDNTFLSPLVRIQSERQQQVISSGVYGWVRHPMYLGAILMLLGGPLLTGSAAALIVGVLLAVLLAVRITGEEKLLAKELLGYEDYRARVRYRLIPLVW
jgi:protein-S-isoprenylcysteine O-methyltransferase Ste14